MENLKKYASLVAEGLNVLSGLKNKKGIGVIFNLTDEAMAALAVDPVALKAELPLLLVPEKRKEVVDQFKGKLALENKVNEAKIKDVVDVASDGVDAVVHVLSVVNKVKALVA